MSSLTYESSEKVTYEKRGSFFEEFMEGLDWKSFGGITYQGMKDNGYVRIFLKIKVEVPASWLLLLFARQ